MVYPMADGTTPPKSIETQEARISPAPSEAGKPVVATVPREGQVLPPDRPKKRRRVFLLIPMLLAAGGGWFGYDWWVNGRFLVSTDDAYVRADVAQIAAKVSGYVVALPIANNVAVKAGTLLAKIDDGDYRLALESAQNKVATQLATIQRLDDQIKVQDAAIAQAQAQLVSAEADVTRTNIDYDRYVKLVGTQVVSQQRVDQALADRDRARAAVTAAQAAIVGAKANRAVAVAQREEAAKTLEELRTQVKKAERDLAFTEIRAPSDGVFGNRSVEEGAFVQAGGRIGALVPMSSLYIEANFKETQLGRLQPGQGVSISVDADPSHTLHGRVESFAPGSGATFSLLPPENATGNFTKIIQRVPVRVAFDEASKAMSVLRPGLSVVVSVDTRTDVPPAAGTALAAEQPRRP